MVRPPKPTAKASRSIYMSRLSCEFPGSEKINHVADQSGCTAPSNLSTPNTWDAGSTVSPNSSRTSYSILASQPVPISTKSMESSESMTFDDSRPAVDVERPGQTSTTTDMATTSESPCPSPQLSKRKRKPTDKALDLASRGSRLYASLKKERVSLDWYSNSTTSHKHDEGFASTSTSVQSISRRQSPLNHKAMEAFKCNDISDLESPLSQTAGRNELDETLSIPHLHRHDALIENKNVNETRSEYGSQDQDTSQRRPKSPNSLQRSIEEVVPVPLGERSSSLGKKHTRNPGNGRFVTRARNHTSGQAGRERSQPDEAVSVQSSYSPASGSVSSRKRSLDSFSGAETQSKVSKKVKPTFKPGLLNALDAADILDVDTGGRTHRLPSIPTNVDQAEVSGDQAKRGGRKRPLRSTRRFAEQPIEQPVLEITEDEAMVNVLPEKEKHRRTNTLKQLSCKLDHLATSQSISLETATKSQTSARKSEILGHRANEAPTCNLDCLDEIETLLAFADIAATFMGSESGPDDSDMSDDGDQVTRSELNAMLQAYCKCENIV